MYKMTPAERRAVALRRSELPKGTLYDKYVALNSKTQSVESNTAAAPLEKEKSSDSNWFVRGLSTVGDFVGNVLTGTVKGLEGIYDFGAGIVGAVGGAFSDEFGDKVKKHIQYDFTGKNVGTPLNDLFSDSYLKSGGIIESVANGIGQILPAVAISLGTAGVGSAVGLSASAAAKAGQVASLASTAVSAAGTSTESAYNDGADYYEGLVYGTASGAVEAATEKLFGGATKNVFGKGMLDSVGKEVAETGAKRIAKNAIEEGIEEGVAELVNPTLKSIYKGKSAFNEYGEGEYWKGVGESALVGSLTGLAYSGTVGYGVSKATGQPTGKAADIKDSLTAINNQNRKAETLFANDKLTDANKAHISENLKANYKNIEMALQSASEAKRKKLIADFSLEYAFEPDGKIKADFAASLEPRSSVGKNSENAVNGEISASQNPDERYVSPALVSSGEKITEALASTTEDLRRAYAKRYNVSLEEAARAVADVRIFKDELTEKGKKAYTSFKKAVNRLNAINGGEGVKIVVTEPHNSYNAALVDDTIYIGADTFENGTWAESLVHEYTHFAEGSEEYNKLVRFLKGDEALHNKTVNELLQKGGYGFDADKTSDIINRYNKMKASGKTVTDVDSRGEIKYNKKYFKFKHKNFPPENESGSEAHRLAVWWTRQKDVQTGDRTLISYHDNWYLVEKFDDADNHYQVEEYLTKAEFNKIFKEIKEYGRSGEIKSILAAPNGYDSNNRQYYSLKGRESSSDSDAARYGREDTKVVRLDSQQIDRGERASSDGSGDSSSSSANQQGDNLNTTVDNEVLEALTEDELKYIRLYKSELGAHLTANLLGNENFVDRLVREDTTIAEKVLNKISDLRRMLESFSNPEARAEYKKIKKAEKLYLDAVENAGYAYVGRKIIGAIEERDGKTQFELKTEETSQQILSEMTAEEREKCVAVSEFIDEVNDMIDTSKRAKRKKKIGIISANHAKLIDEIMSIINPSFSSVGYELWIDGTCAQHIERRHGDKGESDRTMASKESKALIAWAAQNAESCEFITDANGNIERSDRFFNTDGSRAYEIKLKKKAQGEIIYVSECVPDSKNKRIWLTSAYINKNGSKGQLLNMENEISPQPTPEASFDSNATTISIYETSEKINPSDKKTSKNSKFNLKPDDSTAKLSFAKVAPEYDEKQLKNNAIEVVSMEPVSSLDGTEFSNDGKTSLKEKVIGFFDSLGRKVETESLGVVGLTPSSFSDDRGHGLTKNKIVSFKAIPEVLKNGKIIDVYYPDGKQYERITVSAPILIQNEKYYMGVMVQRDNQSNRVYLHDVITEKATLSFTTEPATENGEGIRDKGHLFITSILQNALNVNREKKENSAKFNLKPGDKVTKSKGEYQKQKANYTKKRVYSKTDVNKALLDVPYISTLPKSTQNDILDSMWYSLNTVEGDNQKDRFIESSFNRILRDLWQESKEFANLSSDEVREVELKLHKTIRNLAKHGGSPSALSKLEAEFAKSEAGRWRSKYNEAVKWNQVIGNLITRAEKMRDIKYGTFLNASQYKTDLFKGSIEKLSRVKFRGNLNATGTRKIAKDLLEWYSVDNPLFKSTSGDGKPSELYDEYVADVLKAIANGEGAFSIEELSALNEVMGYFIHFIEHYRKVKRNGELVDATPVAKDFINLIKGYRKNEVSFFRKWFEKYLSTFADPGTVARYMDRYEDGFYADIFNQLRASALKAATMERKIREPIEAFYKEHKSFKKTMTERTVSFQGHELPLAQAMLYYMTLHREHAVLGLAKSGFSFVNQKGTRIKVKGFSDETTFEMHEIQDDCDRVISELYSKFTSVEREYISIAEKIFNEDCKNAKHDADVERRGYSNTLDGYYVPIRRGYVAESVDTGFVDEVNRASKASFNKDTVKGAMGELYIEALDTVLDRHVRGISQYVSLASVIDEYDLLYNLDVSGNPNAPTSIRTESENHWKLGNDYFKKLIADMQGISETRSVSNKFIGTVRGGFAKYQLGANPKVWFSQLTSLVAASSILDVDVIVRGVGIRGSDVDKYCDLAKIRNEENTAALAQGVIDKAGKVGDFLMKPIGLVDRLVVQKLFGACQLQIEKNEKLKAGTEENKKKAGELLTKVIFETQQNSLATERSLAMRDSSEFLKSITMFSADAMKITGRFVDSVGEYLHLKRKLKNTDVESERKEIEKKIKSAKKKICKSTSAMVTASLLMALISELFYKFYNKDKDENDTAIERIAWDSVGNLFGGLPLVRDVYSYFTNGYTLDNFTYATINNLLDSVNSIFNTVGDAASGEATSRDMSLMVRKMLYTAGQISGIPTRNLYNVFYGAVNTISSENSYKLDDTFYKQSYSADLKKAIERDDDEMVATIVGLMLDENVGGIEDKQTRSEMNALITAGYNVIPKSTPTTVTVEDEERKLSSSDRKRFAELYSTANVALADLVKLKQYNTLSEAEKADAIKYIYTTYYNLALQDFLGTDTENKNVLFAELLDVELLAVIYAAAKNIKADVDKSGNTITGSRKKKILKYIESLRLSAAEKYLVAAFLGYKNQNGEQQVRRYLNGKKLTKEEKNEVLALCGYAA